MLPFAAPGHPAPRPRPTPSARTATQRPTPQRAAPARSGTARTILPPTPRPGIGTLWLLRAVLAAVPVALGASYLSTEFAREGQLGFPMDDPYIHFQFARNLAHGAGFSFNPGEPTPGATSPLWCILLAAGHVLGAPLEPLAIALGTLSAMAAAVLTVEVGIAAGLAMPLEL